MLYHCDIKNFISGNYACKTNLCIYLRGVIRGEFDEVFLQPECVKLKKIQLFTAESGIKHI